MSKLDKLYQKSKRLAIDKQTKMVIMSDCHRGAGDNFDNFVKNKNIYLSALEHYYKKGFIYTELGDGDDMWEVKDYQDIVLEHLEAFKLLKKFHDNDRLIMIYGNHDICKQSKEILETYFYKYYDKIEKREKDLLKALTVEESLILEYQNRELFMIHGHQVDLLNSTLWRLSRFLVRYLWRPLENIGAKDPTSSARNYRGSKTCENKLQKWSKKNNKIIIAGHTHKPIYPQSGDDLYFNDGSCIHPNGITCLEIENGKITLVRWVFKLQKNNLITVGREVIDGGDNILQFYREN